jgi:hypothetical protein
MARTERLQPRGHWYPCNLRAAPCPIWKQVIPTPLMLRNCPLANGIRQILGTSKSEADFQVFRAECGIFRNCRTPEALVAQNLQ